MLNRASNFVDTIVNIKYNLDIINYASKKSGFTLAEVLITLGIIGIVAAMTIPTLISKYRTKALETGFKKSYSMLMQAVVPLQNEFYGSMVYEDSTYPFYTDFYKQLWTNYKISYSDENVFSNEINNILNYRDPKTGDNLVKDYAGNVLEQAPGCPQLPRYILADGSAVGGMYNCYSNWIVFDVNGAGGPNAIGHDIFYFGVESNTRKLVPLGESSYSFWQYANNDTYCSKNSSNEQNGVGCTYWALKNICPDDETKTYWECLQ